MEPAAVLRSKIEDTRSAVKMAGYLEKRGKLKLVGSWKKYWFVLEGQLLLYYKSQLEYENLSACRGSLNVGLASCVRPGHGHTVQVVTRTQCLTLRTKERALQEQWLQALLDSMALPSAASLKRQSTTGTQHFRYSLDNLPAITETDDERAVTKAESPATEEKTSTLPQQVERQDSVLSRIKRIGGVSYGAKIDKHNALFKSPSVSHIETKTELLEAKRSDRKSQEGRRASKEADSVEAAETKPAAAATDVGYSEVAGDDNEKKSTSVTSLISTEGKRNSVISINEYSEIDMNKISEGASDNTTGLDNEQGEESDEYEEINVEVMNANRNLQNTDNNGNDLDATNEYNEIIMNDSNQKPLVNISLVDENQNTEGVLKMVEPVTEMTNNSIYVSVSGGNKEETKPDEVMEEGDEYYSSYDRVALMKDLGIIPGGEDVEPGLPPRPEASYAAYEECLYEDLDMAGNPDVTKVKKKSNFRDKILLKDFRQHRQLKKTTSNELKALKENGKENRTEKSNENSKDIVKEKEKEKIKESVGEPKVKGKHSFLKKLVMKRKKKEFPSTEAAQEDDEEPMYDECLFGTAPSGEQTPGEPAEEEPGQQLTAGAVAELKDRLKTRAAVDSDEDSADYDTIGSSTTDEQQTSLPDKPDESGEKMSVENLYTKSYKSQQVGMLQLLATPSLPPRRALRPSSPWHDVPTNNAPAYQDDCGEEAEASGHERSKESTIGPLVSDDVLNTPEGFVMIKNKFRQAEKGRKWNPEQQQVSFPKSAIVESQESFRFSNDSTQNNSKSAINQSSMELDSNELDSLEKSNVDCLDMEVSSILEPPVELRREVATAELVDLTGAAVEVEVNRFSNELHVLLAQLAEITSAPLFQIGASKSLLGHPTYLTPLDQELGPIRRRRHSDPDYDVPRPHSFAQLRFQTDSSSSDTSISPDSLEPPIVPLS